MTNIPDGLLDAFWAYEDALMSNDTVALDRLFAPGPETLRGDAAGLLVGHDEISAFRASRGGAPPRRIIEVQVRPITDNAAVIVAITELLTGGRGLQTQLWQHGPAGWQVTVAQVSISSPAFDRRIWRVVGDPLVDPLGPGPLDGHSVAVKDLYAVAGQPVGAGNPAWLASAPIESFHSWAVHTLLHAGASVRGIARTDEFAYSLAGTNAHYGTPPNPTAPHRISGGSSSGSASAVALGHADIGLGTDTGGSIRIPSAYQGLFGIRTTHNAVPRGGLMPLAESFDTIGWMTTNAALLRTVGTVLLPDRAPQLADQLVVVPELLQFADAEIRAAIERFTGAVGRVQTESWNLDLVAARDTMVAQQAIEAWQNHGWWLSNRMGSLGPDVKARFEAAAQRVPDETSERLPSLRDKIRAFVADRVLVLPSAPTVAPRVGADLGPIREANLTLTCIAGLGGLPAVSLPLRTADQLPCGVCLVAGPGRDHDLLNLAVELEQTLNQQVNQPAGNSSSQNEG